MAIPYNKTQYRLQRWEYQYIKDNAANLTNAEFQLALGRGYCTIRSACKLLRVEARKRLLYQTVPTPIPDVEEYKMLYK